MMKMERRLEEYEEDGEKIGREEGEKGEEDDEEGQKKVGR
jgi:hypothetical protein